MALTAPVVSCARGSCKFSLIAVCNELSSLANISTKSLYWRIQVSLKKKNLDKLSSHILLPKALTLLLLIILEHLFVYVRMLRF